MIITDEKLLRVKCSSVVLEEVNELRELLEKELKLSEQLGNPGLGLAAPQIGYNKHFAIVQVPGYQQLNLVNCYVNQGYDKRIIENEGCLSFPNRFERTLRFNEIYVVGNLIPPFEFIATGLLAIAVQHELNHLDGILLPDVALPKIKNIISSKKLLTD